SDRRGDPTDRYPAPRQPSSGLLGVASRRWFGPDSSRPCGPAGSPGSRDWLVTDMFPGSFPFEELESALSRDGLAQAVSGPARAVGLELEAGLVGRIIADVEGQPVLPLPIRTDGDVFPTATRRR